MAYSIYKADGTLVTVPDNQPDLQFYDGTANLGKGVGLVLIGRNTIGYGEPVAQTWLQLTENFCGPNPPLMGGNPLQGQLWFDQANGVLKVNASSTIVADWRPIATVADPSSVTGYDGQVQVNGGIINIWANGAWQQVFPAVYS